jgi:hypothetical protein
MPFTERSAGTRDAILSAARRLLAEHGYEATTIRAVAAEVGVDPSMVMRYYGTRRDCSGQRSMWTCIWTRSRRFPETNLGRRTCDTSFPDGRVSWPTT